MAKGAIQARKKRARKLSKEQKEMQGKRPYWKVNHPGKKKKSKP